MNAHCILPLGVFVIIVAILGHVLLGCAQMLLEDYREWKQRKTGIQATKPQKDEKWFDREFS